MEAIKNTKDLRAAITRLEIEQTERRALVNEQVHTLTEKFKPINIIKGIFDPEQNGVDLKSNLINRAMGLASGLAAKKMLVGKTHNPLKNLIGFLIERTVANNVTKKADGIIGLAGNLMQALLQRKKRVEE